MTDKKKIRNATAEFLIFTAQSDCEGLEVRYEVKPSGSLKS